MTLPEAARRAADQGQTIEAIRLVREATGIGLKEAKEAVESYRRGQPPRDPEAALPPEALAALRDGDAITAIRLVRDATGIGLKEAKEVVESYLAAPQNRQLQAVVGQKRAQGRRKFGIALALLLGGLAAILWLTGRLR